MPPPGRAKSCSRSSINRYRAKLATVFTMSKTLDEIDARLASRMGDPARSVVLAITAPSYRGQKPSGAGQRRGARAPRSGPPPEKAARHDPSFALARWPVACCSCYGARA
jgi:hypothetical protein